MGSAERPKFLLPPAFSHCLADFQRRLSTEQIDEFQFATFQSLQESIENIQKEQAGRQSFRNLNKIRPFIDGLTQYSGIIELFINMQPLLGAIWGPIKFCLQIASKLNEAFDTLLDAYERIGSALPIIQAIDTLFYSQPHVQQVLADVFEDILTFHKRAIVSFSKKTWKLTFRLTFHTFGDMFRDVLKDLERSRELLLQSANIAHFQEAREARIQFTQEFQDRLKREKQEQRLGVIEWLSADHANRASCDQHEELQQRRAEFPSTTQWLFKMAVFRGWMRKSDASSPTFWLCGIPGAGKTMLLSSVVDKVRETFPEAQVIYFYCKCSDHARRTFADVTRALITSILDLNPACLDYLYEKMTASNERYLNSPRLLQDILEELCKSHDLLFICIDGLDECELNERSPILSLIGRITKASRSEQCVRFFLASRKENDIEKSLSTAIRLNIKSHHVESDILSYIKTQTTKLRSIFAFDLAREQEFLDKLSNRPQGMFLLARLIMDNLLAQDNVEDLEEEMESDILPAGIEQAYVRILARLSKNRQEKSRQRAKFILDIITSATRTLQCHEVQGALAIRLDDRTIDFDRRRSRIPLTEICGPIVEVHPNGVIDMIHPTAKSYLIQYQSGFFNINFQNANLIMAKLCVTYLTFPCFRPMISDSEVELHTNKGDYSFQEYATCNWIYHMRESIDFLVDNCAEREESALKTSYNQLRKLHGQNRELEHNAPEIFDFVEQKSLLKCELQDFEKIYSAESIFSEDPNNGESVPHLLVLIGRVRATIERHSLLPSIANQELFVNAYGTAVYKCSLLACSHFRDGFPSKLLRDTHLKRHERPFKCEQEKCDYAAIGFSTKATLARHARLCHEAFTDEPVFPKIDRLSVDRALNNAIDKGNIAAVRTLAIEVIDLQDASTGFLLRAIKGNKRECALILMEILGDTGEMHHLDATGNTALHMLVENEDEELVTSMLATRVSINTLNEARMTPLHIAIKNRPVPMVTLLLRHRHGKNMLTAYKASASRVSILSLAARAGSDKVLRLLLETGRDIFNDGKDIKEALPVALREKKRELVGTLLVWGRVLEVERAYLLPLRDWVLPDVEDMLPVFMKEISIRQASEASIKKLEGKISRAVLENDSDRVEDLLNNMGVNAVSQHIARKHRGSLEAAALYGNTDMVRDLISRVTFTTITTYDGNSAFENAAAGGYESILQLLFNNGADVNQPTGYFSDGTALQRAVENGHMRIVTFLLDSGAKIDHHGTGLHISETSLIKAAQSSFEDIACLLVSRGANIYARSRSGESLLHLAAKKGHEKLLLRLLDSEAHVDELTPTGNTVLMLAAENGLAATIQYLLSKYETVRDQINLRGGAWRDADGYIHPSSALFRAASNGHTSTVEILLQFGTDVNGTSEHGQTALAAAKQNGHDATAHVLRSYGAVLIYDSLRE